MTDLKKLKLASIVTSSPFWMATIVLYLNTKNISLSDIFKIISLYQLAVVVLEYPTGVIGDYFSHKLSITLGFFFSSLGMFLTTLHLNAIYYYLIIVIMAAGTSFVTGSNTALLHKLSDDFKKDSASLKSKTMVWALIALSLGGYIGKYSLVMPVILTGITFLIGFLIMTTIKMVDHQKTSGNIFSKAIEGINHIKSNNYLISILSANALVSGIFLSTKWFYNPFFWELGIDISWWGILISLATLSSIVGVLLYKRITSHKILWFYLSLIILFLLSALLQSKYSFVSLPSLILAHLVGAGYIQTFFEIETNKHLNDATRASVISFGSLLIRLTSSAYIYMTGFVMAKFSMSHLFVFTAILLFVIGIPLILKINNKSNLSPIQP